MKQYDFSAKDVFEARQRISPYLSKTPLEESLYLGRDGRRYFFKLESLQSVKSFKIRGALSKMTTLTDEERRLGVATISSGNHGASVACAAKLLGIPNAVIIVPKNTPRAKTDRIAFYGARVMLMGDSYDEAHRLGMEYIEANGLTYVDAYYDDTKIYGGQGTIALEILEQNPDIDTIVVPIGGGGLSTGIAVAAKAVKPGIRVVGVQTKACPAMVRAFEDRRFYDEYSIAGDSVCDALLGGVGALAYQMQCTGDRNLIDRYIEVDEDTVRRAVRFMVMDEKYIVEGGSCTTVAAVMDHPDLVGGKNVALVLSGGNIDGRLLLDIMNGGK